MDSLPVIGIRFALYADLLVLAGMVAFTFYALSGDERTSGVLPLKRPAVALALIGLALSGFGMVALVASMTGSSIRAVDGDILRAIIGESAIGTAWIVRMAALALAVLAACALDRYPAAARHAVLATTALAIATLVWTGHAGATEGRAGTVHRLSDVIHMLAAAVWIGGIAAFSWMLFRPLAVLSKLQLSAAHHALDRFSRIGTLAVATIVATGIINGMVVVGIPHISRLPCTAYGRLLIVKLLLFAAMLALAALNRWRLTPALNVAIRGDNPELAVINLRRSLLAEGAAALTILTLVAWLGTLDPLGTVE